MSPENSKDKGIFKRIRRFLGADAVRSTDAADFEADLLSEKYGDNEICKKLIDNFKTPELRKHLLADGKIKSLVEQFYEGFPYLKNRKYVDAVISFDQKDRLEAQNLMKGIFLAFGVSASLEELYGALYGNKIEKYQLGEVLKPSLGTTSRPFDELDVANLVALGRQPAAVLNADGSARGIILPTEVTGLTLEVAGLGLTHPDNDPQNPIILTLQYQNME